MVKRIAGHFLRTLWLVLALLVILYAVFIVAARELMPVINRYQPEFNRFLSDTTGLDIDVTRLTGLWRGFTPALELEDIAIRGTDGISEALSVDGVSAELNTLKSLLNLSPVWHNLQAGNVHLNLVEDERGHWTMAGHPLGGRGGSLAYLNRMFYYSRFLRIDTLDVSVEFYSGTRASFRAHNLQVDNDGDFHRLSANLTLDDSGRDAAALVFEGTGDPGNIEEFVGEGYLNLRELNLSGSISTLLGRLFPEQVAEIGEVETDVGLEFWFDWRRNELVNGRGRLKASEVPLNWILDSPPIEDFSSDVTAWVKPGEDWGFQLSAMHGRWQGADIQPQALEFRQGVGRRWGEVEISAGYLDIETAVSVADRTGAIQGKWRNVLKDLSPAGALRRMSTNIDFSAGQPEFTVRANIDDVSLGTWRGSPQVRGVDGYVEATLDGGFVVLDTPSGLAMKYPQVYDHFMPYGSTVAKVAWEVRRDEGRVLVSSNRIHMAGEEGHGSAVLHLDLPLKRGGDPQMYLMVGMKDSHTRYLERYLPQRGIDPRLQDWLREAVGEGELDEVGFIWRGSLKKTHHIGRSIQVFSKFRDTGLRYQEGWPDLEQARGTVAIDNVSVDAWIDQGRLANIPIGNLRAEVSPRARFGPLLQVRTTLSAPVADGLEILANSPIGGRYTRLNQLETEGEAEVDLDLRVPLTQERTGEDYRVNARLDSARLRIPDTSLWLEDIDGTVHFDTANGLSARELSAALLGNSLKIEVSTGDEAVNVAVRGLLAADALKHYLPGYSDRVQGAARVTGRMGIPLNGGAEPVGLSINSTLTGLSVDLPAPFAKSADEQAKLDAFVNFAPGLTAVSAGVQYKGAAKLEFSEGTFARGSLALLADEAALPADDGFLVTGTVPLFDWQEWQSLVMPQSDADQAETFSDYAELKPRFDLRFEKADLGGIDFSDAQLTGGLEAGGWNLNIDAENAKGVLRIPQDHNVPSIRLTQLTLPSLGKNQGKDDKDNGDNPLLGKLDPRKIPPLDFAVDELHIGEQRWGSLSFEARKLTSGIVLRKLTGSIRGIDITPQVAASEQGDPIYAELYWAREGDQDVSRFAGALSTANVESVFTEWQIPAPLRSESGAFYADMSWHGAPWEMKLLDVDGYLGLEFVDGQFYKATNPGTDTFFRLVSLINFDTWLRRLRFDFSDLFSEGVSFDKVSGGLLFQHGQLIFDDPVVATMPSGKIRLMGSADLAAETLDARLVATMPVGTNLPWVAGLLGGLPAAAGVFLTSKLFAKQVDQLSSLSYRIEGTFDDPDVEVEQIFTDPTKGN